MTSIAHKSCKRGRQRGHKRQTQQQANPPQNSAGAPRPTAALPALPWWLLCLFLSATVFLYLTASLSTTCVFYLLSQVHLMSLSLHGVQDAPRRIFGQPSNRPLCPLNFLTTAVPAFSTLRHRQYCGLTAKLYLSTLTPSRLI